MKEHREKTGWIRLARMLQDGKINMPFLWIDTYNQRVDGIAGTIKARIDGNCMYFVSVLENDVVQGFNIGSSNYCNREQDEQHSEKAAH